MLVNHQRTQWTGGQRHQETAKDCRLGKNWHVGKPGKEGYGPKLALQHCWKHIPY